MNFLVGNSLFRELGPVGLPLAAVDGENTVWRLDFAHPWSAGATFLFLVLGLGWVGWCYAREGAVSRLRKTTLAVLRGLVLLLLLGMIFELRLSAERVVLPGLPLLLDVSASMAETDVRETPAERELPEALVKRADLAPAHRLNQALALLLEANGALPAGLDRRYAVTTFGVGTGLDRLTGPIGDTAAARDERAKRLRTLRPEAPQSRLGQAVLDVLAEYRGREPAAIVLFSDGINTGGPSLTEAAEQARRRGVPIYCVALGRETVPQDVAVDEVLADEVVFVNDVVLFNVAIQATGLAGERAKLILRTKNSRTPLAEQIIELPAEGAVKTVQLPYRPTEEGEFDFVAEVVPHTKETRPDNNSAAVHVTVRKGKFKVLLVEGYPRYEFRYLKSLLERDETIDLKILLQGADRQWAAVEREGMVLPVFPVSKSELSAFDVTIFGDVNPEFIPLSAQSQLAQAVREQGRGLICIAGGQYLPGEYRSGPLRELFPLDVRDATSPPAHVPLTDGFRPVLTDAGRLNPIVMLGDSGARSDAVWRELPPLFWSLRGTKLKPGAFALLEHPTLTTSDGGPLPLAALHQVGRGRVLFHAMDETWRWRERVGDVYFARYWLQAIRFAAAARAGRSGTVELTTDRTRYELGETVQIEAAVPDADAGQKLEVVIEQQDQRSRVTLTRRPQTPDRWSGSFRPAREGRFHAWLRTTQTEGEPAGADFLVEIPQGETRRLQTDLRELKRTAAVSGGKAYALSDVDRLVGDLPPGRTTAVEAEVPYPLWNRWYVLLLFVGLLTAEWVLRKRSGLI